MSSISELQARIDQLTADNAELSEKVRILSEERLEFKKYFIEITQILAKQDPSFNVFIEKFTQA